MPNIFLCVAWPFIIYVTIMAYRISKRKFKPSVATIIAGISGAIAALVSANGIAALYSLGHFDFRYILDNLIVIFSPWLPS